MPNTPTSPTSAAKRWGARIEGGKIVFLPGVAWVRASDYDALAAECERLRDQNADTLRMFKEAAKEANAHAFRISTLASQVAAHRELWGKARDECVQLRAELEDIAEALVDVVTIIEANCTDQAISHLRSIAQDMAALTPTALASAVAAATTATTHNQD